MKGIRKNIYLWMKFNFFKLTYSKLIISVPKNTVGSLELKINKIYRF
jgi:hypothetical protein